LTGRVLDLKGAATILWRHKIVVGLLIVAGIVGNVGWTLAQPATFTSSALVVVPASATLNTQAVVVSSIPVLTTAVRSGDLGVSAQTLRERIATTFANSQTIGVSADASTAQQSEREANAVARSYVTYVDSDVHPLGAQPTQFLQAATTAVAKPQSTRVYQAAGAGGLAALIIALIGSLAIWGSDRRLRERDSIADSIGVPVLASLRAGQPRDARWWTDLLDGYEPDAADAWQLERLLRHPGPGSGPGLGGATSIGLLSVSGDSQSLALGPQLAAFASGQKIPTALAVGPVHDPAVTAALRQMSHGARDRENPRVDISTGSPGSPDDGAPTGAALTVAVATVNGTAPRVGTTMRTDVTLLAVTAGTVTAEQLARVVASAASVGRIIDGVIVGNPVPGDHTTGRIPQIARPQQAMMPTRVAG
jgi:capsular polysaccharide biosynthesis protein